MPTLAELQRAFARGIDGDPSDAGHWIVDDGIDPAARLGIYRNNVDAIVAQYLNAAFPAVARLGGDEFVIVLPDAGAQMAEVMAAAVREAITRPIHLREHGALVSVGVSLSRRQRGFYSSTNSGVCAVFLSFYLLFYKGLQICGILRQSVNYIF